MKNGHIFATPSAHYQVNVWKLEDYIIYQNWKAHLSAHTKGTTYMLHMQGRRRHLKGPQSRLELGPT